MQSSCHISAGLVLWDLLSLLGLVVHSNKYLDDHRIIYGNVRHKIISACSLPHRIGETNVPDLGR